MAAKYNLTDDQVVSSSAPAPAVAPSRASLP